MNPLHFSEYASFQYNNRNGKRGGGIGAYFKDGIKYRPRIDIDKKDTTIEHKWFEVKGKKARFSCCFLPSKLRRSWKTNLASEVRDLDFVCPNHLVRFNNNYWWYKHLPPESKLQRWWGIQRHSGSSRSTSTSDETNSKRENVHRSHHYDLFESHSRRCYSLWNSKRPKEVWSTIHRILKPSSKKIQADPDTLNQHFNTTAGRLLNSKPKPEHLLHQLINDLPEPENAFDITQVTYADDRKTINNLQNDCSTGTDQIQSKYINYLLMQSAVRYVT